MIPPKGVENRPSVLFKPLWRESVLAVKTSVRCRDFDHFRAYMDEHLPQNSEQLRKRFTSMIITRFFPERTLESLPALVWRHYKDDTLLQAVMRYQFLTREPIIAEFVREQVTPMQAGFILDREILSNFITSTYGVSYPDSVVRLSSAINDLGLVYRDKGHLVKKAIEVPRAAFLLLTHYLFAPEPRTVALSQIISDPYWCYVGMASHKTVRKTLAEAAEQGIISKYTVVDELEQITTKYTFKELLEDKMWE